MEIYIESFIIQNVIINFCLLRLVYLTTKAQSSFFRQLVSSIIGTIPSILISILLNNTYILNLFKIFTALIMICIAFKQTKKQFFFNTLMLFIYTYAFGGIVISLGSSSYYTPFGIITSSKFSLEIICLLICVGTYFFECAVKYLKFKLKTSPLIYDIKLYQNNKSIKLNAYLDTGNLIEHNGNPILILDIDYFLKLYNINLIEFLTIKTEEISTKTVTGNKNLKLFNIDKLEIKNGKKTIKLNNQIVAINTNNSFKNTNYKALISPLFL